VPGGGQDDVAPVTANVDPLREFPGARLHANIAARMAQIEVGTFSTRPCQPGLEISTRHVMSLAEVVERSKAFRVDIEDEEAADRSSPQADVGVGPPVPPAPKRVGVSGGVDESARRPRMFASATVTGPSTTTPAGTVRSMDRKDRATPAGHPEGGVDRCLHEWLRYGVRPSIPRVGPGIPE